MFRMISFFSQNQDEAGQIISNSVDGKIKTSEPWIEVWSAIFEQLSASPILNLDKFKCIVEGVAEQFFTPPRQGQQGSAAGVSQPGGASGSSMSLGASTSDSQLGSCDDRGAEPGSPTAKGSRSKQLTNFEDLYTFNHGMAMDPSEYDEMVKQAQESKTCYVLDIGSISTPLLDVICETVRMEIFRSVFSPRRGAKAVPSTASASSQSSTPI